VAVIEIGTVAACGGGDGGGEVVARILEPQPNEERNAVASKAGTNNLTVEWVPKAERMQDPLFFFVH
jgi:hypothetical protein